VQLLVLAPGLNLLPLWDDERYTLETAARGPAGIIRALQVDVHPPLYYFLVKAWLALPLPGTQLERARALSALLALASTAIVYFLWLRRLERGQQALFLGLWVLSPCLALYGRMARSYTLQVALALVAIHLARQWLDGEGGRRSMGRYVAAATLLLYTHYLPGLAVMAGTTALDLWRRRWRRLTAPVWIGLLYLPWMAALAAAAGLAGSTKPYWLGANWAVENALKLAYAFVAFQFGETIPAWAGILTAGLVPGVGWALVRSWRAAKRPPALFLLLAAIGYFVAASWVSFAFVGARLLFLLPFYYLFLLRGLEVRRLWGAVTYTGLLVVACGGLASYHRRLDFLNKGYLVDFEQVARLVEQRTGRQRVVVLLDRFASSAGYYLHGLELEYVAILSGPAARREAVERLERTRPPLVWYLRYTRDPSSRELVATLARDYRLERHSFVRYSTLDRKVLGWLGVADQPSYVLEALELRR